MKHASKIQADLVGLSKEELLRIVPEATHQHFKGGLYRYLGIAKDADTGEVIKGKDGLPRVTYQHLYPHPPEIWMRDMSEWVSDKEPGTPRFKELRF